MLFMFRVVYEEQKITYLFGYGKDLSWYWYVTGFHEMLILYKKLYITYVLTVG